jgi:hypothetical protein
VVCGGLNNWLKKPFEDWRLPHILLGEVKKKLELK